MSRMTKGPFTPWIVEYCCVVLVGKAKEVSPHDGMV